jgi:L-rhamnose isomerase/sugar isomerase
MPLEPQLVRQQVADHDAASLAVLATDVAHATDVLGRAGIDAESVVRAVQAFSVAAPSWALGTGATRFGRFPGGGEPRTTAEKVDDVAALHALTGANRTISLHVPWDDPKDPTALREYAATRGIAFDAMNSNTFQDNPATTNDGQITYKWGSLSSTDAGARKAAVEHNLACIALGVELGSTALTVWLADGMNHPGQASFRGQFERVATALTEIHDGLPDDWSLFTEHKPFEPAFYSSVNNDWGSSLLLAQAAGDRARCLVDLGHHLPNTNIEQVVSRLAMVGRLGGFHFNDSKYGDDDLTAGSVKPFQLFLIMLELRLTMRETGLTGNGALPPIAFMIDASHNVKDPLEDLLQSTDALQLSLAQALAVDLDRLADVQEANDPALAAELLHAAFRTDVRPLVAEARRRNGAALSPLDSYRAIGYRAAVTAERGVHGASTGL